MMNSTQAQSAHEFNDSTPKGHGAKQFLITLVGCIGIVYGDIGTSPLYAFRESIHKLSHGGLENAEIFGILSLIIWSLLLIVTVKYVLFLLNANHKGEGGILVLMNMVRKAVTQTKLRTTIMFVGVVGASLFYADAAITPAISVMSAIEGLKEVTPIFKNQHYILALSIAILCVLFYFQKFGTHRVSALFGPITLVWFLVMGGLGIYWIAQQPAIFQSFNPYYAIQFLLGHGFLSFMIMGSVFLSVTGAEALYADMGHFGLRPIQIAWLFVVFPCLVLNYMGQGALIMTNPAAIANPFFMMAPEWGVLPLVILATVATIVAAQAVITGAYSLTQQAIQLKILPRMEIRYTSQHNIGQIYMPGVNKILLYGVLFFCILFQNSAALAAAYGIAVCGTMVITTMLAFFVVHKIWNRSIFVSLLLTAPFMIIEGAFLAANLIRIFEGGFVPVLFGIYLSLLMGTWIYGGKYLREKSQRKSVRVCDFAEELDHNPPVTVEGTAIFFTYDALTTPESLIKNIRYNHIIHQHNIVLTVVTAAFPHVDDAQRIQVERISTRLTRVIIHFGFMETPDVPRALALAKSQGMEIDLDNAIYFLTRRKIVSDPHHGLPAWQDKLYIALTRLATGEHDFYKLPRSRVVELGVQIAI